MLNHDYEYWHVSIDLSKASRLRFVDALIITNSGLECGDGTRLMFGYGLERGNTGVFVVRINKNLLDQFKKIAKPIKIIEPPKVCVR